MAETGAETGRLGARPVWAGRAFGVWPRWVAEAFREGWLARAILAEREARRPFLFLPIGMIGGVLLFFAADREPSLWAGPFLFGLAALAALAAWRRHLTGLTLCALALACMAAGFSAAAFKAWLVTAPVLDKAQGVKGTAVILQNDRRGGG